MIELRAQQIHALAQSGLVERLKAFLNEAFPQSRKMPAEDLKAVLRSQLQRCQGYGFETERQAAIYIVSAWLLGERFDEEHRGAVEILTSTADPDLKARLLEDWTRLLIRSLEE